MRMLQMPAPLAPSHREPRSPLPRRDVSPLALSARLPGGRPRRSARRSRPSAPSWSGSATPSPPPWTRSGLLALEKRLIEQAKADRNNAMTHLRLGFLSLRLGDLGGQSHYEDAASEFQWAIDLQPTWPYSWYGMGLRRVRRRRLADLLRHRHQDHAGQGRAHPLGDGVRQVGRGGSQLRPRPGGPRQHRPAAAGQHQARRGAGSPASRRVHRGGERIPRSCWPAAGSSGRWATATRRSPPSRATWTRAPIGASAQLEVARTLFLLGRFDGVAPYFEGAASDDSVTVAGYRADLATIASDSVMGEFDRTAGQRRADYLKQFWSERDQIELRADGERLREHYRRLFYARKNFQLTSLNRHYDIVERYRSGSRDFDDRGVIYIRHGEPSSRASYAAPGLEPNESWRYSRPDGDMIFHFMAREDVQDYKLVESLFDVLGFSNALALRGEASPGRTCDPDGAAAPALARAALADLRAAPGGGPDQHRPLPGPRSGRSGRRASRWEPPATATSCASPTS